MAPKTKNNENDTSDVTILPVKAKRGRKSKKELMAALNISDFLAKEKDNKKNNQNSINLNVLEIENNSTKIINNEPQQNNLYEHILNNDNTNENNNVSLQTDDELTNIITLSNTSDDPKIGKKRGRKPRKSAI